MRDAFHEMALRFADDGHQGALSAGAGAAAALRQASSRICASSCAGRGKPCRISISATYSSVAGSSLAGDIIVVLAVGRAVAPHHVVLVTMIERLKLAVRDLALAVIGEVPTLVQGLTRSLASGLVLVFHAYSWVFAMNSGSHTGLDWLATGTRKRVPGVR